MSRSRRTAALKVNDAVPVFAALGDATRLKAKQYLDQVATHWDEAADRLKAFVEDQ